MQNRLHKSWERLAKRIVKFIEEKKKIPNLEKNKLIPKLYGARFGCMPEKNAPTAAQLLSVVNFQLDQVHLILQKHIEGEFDAKEYFNYEIFLHFRSPELEERWFEDNKELLTHPLLAGRVFSVDKFRERNAWIENEKRFNTVETSTMYDTKSKKEYKAEFDDAYDKDLNEYMRREENKRITSNRDELREYYRKTAIDRLCMMPALNGNKDTLNVCFLDREETLKIWRLVGKYAEQMHADNSYLVDVKLDSELLNFEFDNNCEIKSETANFKTEPESVVSNSDSKLPTGPSEAEEMKPKTEFPVSPANPVHLSGGKVDLTSPNVESKSLSEEEKSSQSVSPSNLKNLSEEKRSEETSKNKDLSMDEIRMRELVNKQNEEELLVSVMKRLMCRGFVAESAKIAFTFVSLEAEKALDNKEEVDPAKSEANSKKTRYVNPYSNNAACVLMPKPRATPAPEIQQEPTNIVSRQKQVSVKH